MIPVPPSLAAILAAPDDDAPRHVLADQLVERGDPRGEFIQLQLRPEVARQRWGMVTQGEPAELPKKAERIAAKHQKTWLAPFRASLLRWMFHRGFLWHVESKPEQLPLQADVMVALEPVEIVKISGMKPPLAKALAGHAFWAKIREPRRRDAAAHRAVARRAPRAAALRDPPPPRRQQQPDRGRGRRGDRGRVAAVAAHARRARRQARRGRGGRDREDASHRLAGAPGRPDWRRRRARVLPKRLVTLHAWGCQIGDCGAAAIAEMPALVELHLEHDGLGDAAARALARARTIRRLRLGFNAIGDDGARALLEMPALESLSLYGAQLSPGVAEAVNRRFGPGARRAGRSWR